MNSFTGTTEQATSDSRPVALIAGATGGVGQQCTFELIRAGYRVVALSRSDTKLEDLSRRILEAGPAESLITLRADITAAQAAQHIRQNAERKLGRLDLLLLYAGITSNKSTGLNDTEVTTVIAETEPPATSFRHIDGRNRPSSSSTVIDVALMTVSPRFIPLDSSYEEAVEEKLWQEKRTFIKPLRYDGEEDVFPDFVLKDVPGVDALPMEVFGMNTPEYLLRMQEKTSYYEAQYGPGHWWSWNAAEKSDMPAFPSV
ncbi:MAG: SDR family NAD(P)-dependent oxidoreductase [Pantoea agglomerans]